MSDCLSYTIFPPLYSSRIHKLGHVSNTYFKLTTPAKCSVFHSKRSSVSIINSTRNWDAIPFPSGEHEYDDDLEFGVINKAKSRWRNDQEEEAAANSGIHEEDLRIGEILKFRDNKEKKGNKLVKDEEEFRKMQGLGSKLEELQVPVPVAVVKRRREMMRRSNVIAKQVISIRSAISFGFVSQLWVNTSSWDVLVVEVRPNLLSSDSERFLLKEIVQVGDVILVEDENVIEDDIKMVGLETLVGYSVVTPSGQSIGKVRGYSFNIKAGTVESLELDSFGISIIPPSLVSTYVVFVDDVVEVLSDTVVVHEAAVQRLTKGLWGRQNAGNNSNNEFEQQLEDYTETRRKNSSSLGKSKSRRKKRKSVDEWELPMDFL